MWCSLIASLWSSLKSQEALSDPDKTCIAFEKNAKFPPLTSILSWHLVFHLKLHQISLVFSQRSRMSILLFGFGPKPSKALCPGITDYISFFDLLKILISEILSRLCSVFRDACELALRGYVYIHSPHDPRIIGEHLVQSTAVHWLLQPQFCGDICGDALCTLVEVDPRSFPLLRRMRDQFRGF